MLPKHLTGVVWHYVLKYDLFIASIEDLRVCIQCKCFAKAVENKAIQEIAAGMIYWIGTHSVVVAKSGFTKFAEALANSTNVILTSDKELKDLENLVL